jgi:hypothetical protein
MHGDMLRPVPELGEKFGPRAGHPGLRVERADLVEKRGAAGGVEMGGDFIQQNEGRGAGFRLQTARVGEDERDQERLLFPGGALARGASLST